VGINRIHCINGRNNFISNFNKRTYILQQPVSCNITYYYFTENTCRYPIPFLKGFSRKRKQPRLTLTVYALKYYPSMEPDGTNPSVFIGIFFYFTGENK
jgi:hypothetical protein